MSTYGNRCWTEEREALVNRLIVAGDECDDDTVYEIMDGITTLAEMKAIGALGIEAQAYRLGLLQQASEVIDRSVYVEIDSDGYVVVRLGDVLPDVRAQQVEGFGQELNDGLTTGTPLLTLGARQACMLIDGLLAAGNYAPIQKEDRHA